MIIPVQLLALFINSLTFPDDRSVSVRHCLASRLNPEKKKKERIRNKLMEFTGSPSEITPIG